MPASARPKNTALMPMAKLMFCTRMLRVRWLRLMNSGNLPSSSSIRATSAVSMAVSLPAAPMAKPMSACARAGASLTPSPSMATTPNCCCKALISSSLFSGNNSALTTLTPTSSPMRCAVSRLSPVSITVVTPSAFSLAMADAAVGRSTSATAITPSAPAGVASTMAV